MNSKILEEEKFYFYIIDLLSHEYGWSIEYIQTLEMPSILKLMEAISNRKDYEDQIHQVNVAKGFGGKISSNRQQKDAPISPQEELKNLKKLSDMLKVPLKQKDKNGKLSK